MSETVKPSQLTCKDCGEVKPPLSRHKLCFGCQRQRMIDNIQQLRMRTGKYYNRWKKNVIRGTKTSTSKDHRASEKWRAKLIEAVEKGTVKIRKKKT